MSADEALEVLKAKVEYRQKVLEIAKKQSAKIPNNRELKNLVEEQEEKLKQATQYYENGKKSHPLLKLRESPLLLKDQGGRRTRRHRRKNRKTRHRR